MRVPHGWECTTHRCGTYNAMHYAECRVCGAPRDSGRLLYTVAPDPPAVPPPPLQRTIPPTTPVPASPLRWQLPGWAWALGAIVVVVVFLAQPGLCLIGLFFALLWAIAAGIWRLASRFPR